MNKIYCISYDIVDMHGTKLGAAGNRIVKAANIADAINEINSAFNQHTMLYIVPTYIYTENLE